MSGGDQKLISDCYSDSQKPPHELVENLPIIPYEIERGAYLLVKQVMKAFSAIAFEGWARSALLSQSADPEHNGFHLRF